MHSDLLPTRKSSDPVPMTVADLRDILARLPLEADNLKLLDSSGHQIHKDRWTHVELGKDGLITPIM